VGPHFYTEDAEIDEFFTQLEQLRAGAATLTR